MPSIICRTALAILTLTLIILSAGLAYAQAPAGQAYVVRPGDRLVDLARQFLGSAGTYQDIVAATNAKAAEDGSFVAIADPDRIQAGQKLWVPVAGFGGTYTAMLPAASSPGRAMRLTLAADGSAELSADYLNGEAPIVETGTWQDNGDGTATVTLTGQAGGVVYEAPAVITFELAGDTLTAVEYDQSLYGSEGLTLQRQAQTAPASQPEAINGIYKVMLPGASSPGLDMTLYLNADNTVRQVSDYLNGETPVVEIGTWQIEGDRVVVTFSGLEGQPPYEQASLLTLQPGDEGLTTVPAEDTAGTGRWTYRPFAALALGQQAVPYNAVQAGQVISATGLTGIYKGFPPAAACCGQNITLSLNFDHSAALQTDYLNGEAPLVETGVWTTTPNSQVEVTLTNTATPLTLEVKEGLLVTSPDEDAYGQAGLSLYRFEVIAQNSLQLTVTGAVTYLQRSALPPDAVVEVKLVQVVPGSAVAAPIGEQVITSPGQVPIPFTLTYKLGDIDWTQTYAIQAQITAGGQLLFTTPHTYTVITQGNPDTVEVVLEPVSATTSAEP